MRLHDWLDKKQIGSGIVVAALSVLLAALLPVLSAFIPRLNTPILVPVWLFISLCAIAVAILLWLLAGRNQTKVEVREAAATRDVAIARLEAQPQVVFEHGAYFQAEDEERKQPFCRNCWETMGNLVSAREFLEEDRRGDWSYRHYCPNCDNLYWESDLPNSNISDDDEIPF